MTARETVLARVREALADLPADRRTTTVPREYLRHAPGLDPHDHDAVVSLFIERLKHYGAQSHRVHAAALPDTIAAALRGRDAHSVIAPAGVPASWLAGWAAEPGNRVLSDDPQLSPAELDAVDAVVTGCAAAVADSGTVVLDGGPGQGRRAPTLVPDCHICVVRAEQIASSIPEIIGLLDPQQPHTWFSGPSATVDIEMIRVQGVHGPRRLVVVIVE
ncbi:LUD domain-containing protein [Nocardia sp. 2]|uniref:LUD domain-containing protein n=1 Tax=Nocardia acididurans TaxID=2802282 RepID=A0ABS1LYR3_9NOCA|nr:LUD domain-containing protein [Nocardia acididurans]MBL1073552.1 LUD domain-containing protein [Nocardia acididurans]